MTDMAQGETQGSHWMGLLVCSAEESADHPCSAESARTGKGLPSHRSTGIPSVRTLVATTCGVCRFNDLRTTVPPEPQTTLRSSLDMTVTSGGAFFVAGISARAPRMSESSRAERPTASPPEEKPCGLRPEPY